MLPAGTTYEAIYAAFRWQVPTRFNIGVACCDVWADGSGRTALIHRHDDGRVERLSFDFLKSQTNRLANALKALGMGEGARIGVLLPQVPEAAIAHLAIYKLGAIAVPLFQLFQAEALEYRLRDSGASALITDALGVAKLETIRHRLPALRVVLSADGPGDGVGDLDAAMAMAREEFVPRDTSPEDPALIIYTSGTTGAPKGALHGHRVLLGHLPGVEMPQDRFPQPGDLFWTPADWAWIGGLLDVLLPSLFHGVPVLAHRMAKFDPEFALRLMADLGVRNAFLPPTALKMMRLIDDPTRFGARLRSLGSGGETLGAELLDWGRRAFGVTINEFYGQTECNLVVASCGTLMPGRPGWMGRAVPGHRVAIVDDEGIELSPGTLGTIAIRRPDPVMFLGYWNNPDATASKFRGNWLLTGDKGVMDAEGWFKFIGRDDDVITSAGYRIGPGEIEDCLLRHPAVAMAAVIGLPDSLRTEAVTAVIVPAEGISGDARLASDLQDHVRSRLAAHSYPRRIVFRDALPMTATGKVMRGVLRQALIEECPACPEI